jgi:uncharacterized protein (UPF0333 family)
MNKKLLIGIGVVAAIGGYMYYKNKKAKDAAAAATQNSSGSGRLGGAAASPTSHTTTLVTTASTMPSVSLGAPMTSSTVSLGTTDPYPTAVKHLSAVESFKVLLGAKNNAVI